MNFKLGHYYRQKEKDRLRDNSIQDNMQNAHEENPELTRQLILCLEKIHSVNKRYARILNLLSQGYNAKDICRRLGITRSNVFTITSRARSLLRHCLEHGGIK